MPAGWRSRLGILKTSVPDLFAKAPPKEQPLQLPLLLPVLPPDQGLISRAVGLFASFGDLREINQLMDGAGSVTDMASRVHDPLRTRIRATIAQEQQFASQTELAKPRGDRTQTGGKSLPSRRNSTDFARRHPAEPGNRSCWAKSRPTCGQWEMSVHREYIHFLESVIIHGCGPPGGDRASFLAFPRFGERQRSDTFAKRGGGISFCFCAASSPPFCWHWSWSWDSSANSVRWQLLPAFLLPELPWLCKPLSFRLPPISF